MKIKVTKKNRDQLLSAMHELREELKDTFGYRIGLKFNSVDDVPLIDFSESQLAEIYTMREQATEAFKHLRKPVRKLYEEMNAPIEDGQKKKIKVDNDMAKSIRSALISLKKLYERTADMIQELVDRSVEEENRIRQEIEDISRSCKYVLVTIDNLYTMDLKYGGHGFSVLKELETFRNIFVDLDITIEAFNKNKK